MILITIDDCYRCSVFQRRNEHIRFIKISDKPLGLGDTLAKLFSKFNFSYCKACRIRQSKLNKLFPYKWTDQYKDERRRFFKNYVASLGESIYPILLDDEGDHKLLSLNDVDKGYEEAVKEFEKDYGLSVD